MKIEVGDYCRTTQGYIAKVVKKDDTFLYFDNTIYNYYEESHLLPIELKMLDGTYIRAEDYIVKHSKNIIDLIEERRLCKWKKSVFNRCCYYEFTNSKL